MRSTQFVAAVGGAVVLAGIVGAAHASATIDLIWIDKTDPACTDDGRRDCPQLGTVISSVAVTDVITLGVIVTPGPNGLQGGGVSVDYRDALPKLQVIDFRSLNTEPFLPFSLGTTTNQPPLIENINSLAHPPAGIGIGLLAGQSAYLGTVTFHKEDLVTGTFEISVGVDGLVDAVLSLDPIGVDISETTTFNSAFLINAGSSPEPTPTPTATRTPTPTPTAVPSGRVALCHKGNRSISAPSNAVRAHLAHGDTLGMCP